MKKNYILVDFENVQPKSLEVLKGHDFEVIVFVGSKQTKISFELASTMQTLGTKARYIKITGNGPNALDFHIAYYIGEFAANNPGSYFHIISKDKGFDQLIAHLKTKKIAVSRKTLIESIPILKISNSSTLIERVDSVIEFLKSRGNMKPRKIKTLKNSINSLFLKKIKDSELDQILESLIKKKTISTNDSKVTYHFV